MDLELLRTFLEVNRLRHFGQAGEVLSLTQAAVSARIKLLESQLGVKLFIRQYHDLQLTPEGNRLVRPAEMMMANWRKARQEIIGGAKQQLTFGGSLRIWDVALQDWFARLREKMPELSAIAEIHTPDLLTRRLLDGHLDVAFLLEPAQIDILQIEKVALVELVMVSSLAGLTAESALEDNYIMVDWGFAHALEHRRLYPDAPEPQLRVAQAKMALGLMLAEKGGAAYLPLRMITQELLDGLLHVVSDAPSLERYAYAVFPIRSEKMALIKKVISYFEYAADIDLSKL